MDIESLLENLSLGDKAQTTPDLLIGVSIFLLATTLILVQGSGLFFPSELTTTTNPHTSDRIGNQIVHNGLGGGTDTIKPRETIEVLNEIETNDSYMEDEYGEDEEVRVRVLVLENGNNTQTTIRRPPPMLVDSSNDYTVREENGRYIAEAETDGFSRGTTTRTKVWMHGERVTVEVTA